MESLLVHVDPLTPAHTVNEASDLFLKEDYQRFLCLPVVDDGRPVGTVSRSDLQKIFMSRYGRELLGDKEVIRVMNPKPLVIDVDMPMDRASQFVADNIRFPITEDFVLVREGIYQGVGYVIDLLRAMERQLDQRNGELASAYHRLQSSQSQLVQSEKMASLGQMVAGVAHEINTPLGYVRNNLGLAREMFDQALGMVRTYEDFLALLTSGLADEETVQSRLASIMAAKEAFEASYSAEDVGVLFEDTDYGIGQISEIVLNLKNFSRLDQAPVDNVDLNECLDSALLIARNVLKHKAEVIKAYGRLPRVSCAPSQINQVFLNLLTNAAQAIETQGRILIKTYADEHYVHAIVQDTGKGIAAEHLKRIFDPFFTTKGIGEGTGLGLSIAYQILQAHKGHIRVASEVGAGTKFCVSLPHGRTLQ